MSVEKTTNGRWLVRWREDGRQRGRRFTVKRDADAWDREVQRRRQLGPLALAQLTEKNGPTLGEWIVERWAPEHGATLSQRTRDRYASSYELHAEPWLGNVPIADLGVARLRTWQAGRTAAGVSADAIIKTRTFLSSVLRHAAESGAILANPLVVVRRPKTEQTEPVRPLAPITVEAVRAVLVAPMPTALPAMKRAKTERRGAHQRCAYDVPDARSQATRIRDAAIVSVLAYAGLRPAELLALWWHDIGERTILVAGGKTGSRSVRLLAPLAADLREWRMAAGTPPDDALIFPRSDGEMWVKSDWDNWRKKTWGKACRLAGMERAPRPYDLRHSFASLLLAEGRTVHYVARQLGHSPTLTLETYGHVIEEFDAAPRIDAEQEIRTARRGACARTVHSTAA